MQCVRYLTNQAWRFQIGTESQKAVESISEPRKPNFVKLYSVDDPLVMDLEPVFRDMEIDELTTDFAIIFRAETGLTVKFQGMDPDEFTVDIPLVLDKQPDKRDECCIYKVPQLLREENNDSYTPKLISIGPFHQGDKNLKSMEDLKMRYLKEACYRTNKSTKDLAGCILENEVKIRHCYAEVFEDISSKDFVKMVLFDSIFIIEHLWRTKQNPPMSPPIVSNSRTSSSFYKCQCRMLDSCLMTCQRGSEEDSRENRNPQPGNGEKENPWQSYNILQDLILLENQVPFFILEELYNFAYRDLNNCCCCQSRNHNGDGDNSFIKLVRDFFFHFWQETGLICSSDYKEILPEEVKKIRHFTDFLRYFLLPKEQKCGQSIDRVPCATKLAEAGVEFRGVKNRQLLDIKFQKSWLLKKFPCLNLSWLLSCCPCFKCLENMQPVLELQFFKVWDATECIIRNLMAFEQSHYPREAYVYM